MRKAESIGTLETKYMPEESVILDLMRAMTAST